MKPYQTAAAAYLIAGWDTVLPLPERSKSAPPAGYTGRNAQEPTEEDMLLTWIQEGGNIAIRLPRGIIGLDFDAYKDNGLTMKTLENELGELPETIAFTSQASIKEGGTFFYRIPLDYEAVGSHQALDLIQHHHRYTVAPPSIHPSGRKYRAVSSSTGQEIPWVLEPETLPELPMRWRDKLSSKQAQALKLEEEELSEIGGLCPRMKSLLIGGNRLLHQNKSSSRHDLLVKTSFALAAAAGEGHTGLAIALKTYEKNWKSKFTPEEAATRPLSLEFQAAVTGAKAKAPRIGKQCSCQRNTRRGRASVATLKMNRYI